MVDNQNIVQNVVDQDSVERESKKRKKTKKRVRVRQGERGKQEKKSR